MLERKDCEEGTRLEVLLAKELLEALRYDVEDAGRVIVEDEYEF